MKSQVFSRDPLSWGQILFMWIGAVIAILGLWFGALMLLEVGTERVAEAGTWFEEPLDCQVTIEKDGEPIIIADDDTTVLAELYRVTASGLAKPCLERRERESEARRTGRRLIALGVMLALAGAATLLFMLWRSFHAAARPRYERP